MLASLYLRINLHYVTQEQYESLYLRINLHYITQEQYEISPVLQSKEIIPVYDALLCAKPSDVLLHKIGFGGGSAS